MRSLSPSQLRKLRGLIAHALDGAATEAEAQGSALAACRLLASEGLGVDGDPDVGVSIGRCSAAPEIEPTPAYVYQAARRAYPYPASVSVGCGRPRPPIWEDLKFGTR